MLLLLSYSSLQGCLLPFAQHDATNNRMSNDKADNEPKPKASNLERKPPRLTDPADLRKHYYHDEGDHSYDRRLIHRDFELIVAYLELIAACLAAILSLLAASPQSLFFERSEIAVSV